MDTNSPTRRKLKRNHPSMQTSQRKGKGKSMMRKQNAWKPNTVPLEIFNLIIQYLPRSTIQDMRLVSREFEANVSEYLFKYVVVPFRPEIYGILSEPSTSQSSILLQDKGMRIFQGFGRHIKHFAMSFEVDMSKLINPPTKHDHDTIVTFWGSYKWPFQTYNRYAQLEGLEQKADETHTMTKALQFIETAEELGLSIDGGLGWLAGPDINQKVVERGEKPVVFGSSRFIPESKPSRSTRVQGHDCRQPLAELSTRQRSIIQRMLQEAGYRNDLLDRSFINTHSDDGQVGTVNTPPRQGRRRNAPSIPYSQFEEGIARIIGGHFRDDGSAVTDDPDDDEFSDEHGLSSEGEAEGDSQGEGSGVTIPSWDAAEDASYIPNGFVRIDDDDDNEDRACESRKKQNPYPLKPNELTGAQKEMLLELEWAQRAFMQTFTIAVIDSPVTFFGVKKLTIARLPSTHLPILIRDDFWNSLPNLNLLSLGIIPDWRELAKLPTSWVQDNRLLPSKAVTRVFQLLSKQISKRQNIQSLHFEWICGGEYAPGIFHRNQHVLAAPVVSQSIEMLNRVGEKEVLSLPYIQNLSLKNCWFSPHIFTEFIKELKESDLQYLTLDSVSLTAFIHPGAHPAPLTTNPWNHQNNLAQAMAANIGINHPFFLPPGINQPILVGQPAQLPVTVNNSNAAPSWMNQPRYGSWAQVIDTLTPGNRLADFRHAGGFTEQPEPREQSGFKMLVFKSCGYVRIPYDFDQSSVTHHGLNHRGSVPAAVTKRINDYESMMMKSGDSLLGSITNTMSDREMDTLKEAWNMNFGWGSLQQMTEAKHDGIVDAGIGRFNGSLDALAQLPDTDLTDL